MAGQASTASALAMITHPSVIKETEAFVPIDEKLTDLLCAEGRSKNTVIRVRPDSREAQPGARKMAM